MRRFRWKLFQKFLLDITNMTLVYVDINVDNDERVIGKKP